MMNKREIKVITAATLPGLKQKVHAYKLDGWTAGGAIDESALQFGKYSIAVIKKYE